MRQHSEFSHRDSKSTTQLIERKWKIFRYSNPWLVTISSLVHHWYMPIKSISRTVIISQVGLIIAIKKKVEVDKISSPRAQNSINSWVDTSLHRVEGHANNKRKSKQHFSSSFLEMYFSNVASLLKFKWKKKSLFASPPHARGVWLQLKCIREIDKQKKSIKIQFFLHLSDASRACIHTIKYECFSFSHLFIIKQIIE